MIELIKSLCKEDNNIKIFFKDSSKSVEGTILKITASSIAVKTIDNRIVGIKGEDIDFFEKGESIDDNLLTNNNKKTESKSKDVDNKDRNDEDTEVKGQLVEETPKSQLVSKNANSLSIRKPENDDEKKKGKLDVTQLKPGDVIPIDQLVKIDPKIQNKRFKKKLNVIGNDFSALGSLVTEEHEIDNLKIVPPIGEVKFVDISRNFGFIADGKTNQDVYFSLSQIVDEDPSQLQWSHTPVVYTLQNDPQGTKAVTVHKPRKIKEMLSIAESLSERGEYKHAFNLVDQILKEYPDNFSADTLKRDLTRRYPIYAHKDREYSNAYGKAKRYHSEKKYDKAIEYYLKAINKGEKVESSIKDLGMLYAFLYKSELGKDSDKAEQYRTKALKLMEDFSDGLSNSVSTWNYLENFYYSVKSFDIFIKVVDNLLDECEIRRDKSRSSALLHKKAVALIQLNEMQDAIDTLDEALEVDSTNQSAIKLKALIENNPDNIQEVILATEFDTLNSGISPFIQQTLDSYDEYAGVPAKIIESNSFNEVTLREIHRLIETAGKARPRDRAKYLLTEGKLITIIEPENTSRLRGVMARYCNAMALNHISDYSQPDVTRFYYNEAFSLEESYRQNATQVSLYILTHFCNNKELMNMTSKTPSLDDALQKVTTTGFEPKCWESILSMLLYNREISAQITSKLYADDSLRNLSLQAIRHFGIKDLPSTISKDEFVEAWNSARDSRIRDYKRSIAQIKALCESSNIEDICQQLQSLRDKIEDWMTSLDVSRINTFINNIYPALETYIKSSGYRNKEANKNNAIGQVSQLIDEIKEGPTKLSYEAMLPLLKRINELVVVSFQEVIKTSTPKITINLLSSETVVNDEDEVSIQIAVSNHKDSSPIREVSVNVKQNEMVKTIDGAEKSYNAIEGGEKQIFKLRIRVGKDVIVQKATALEVVCKYKNGNETKGISSMQSLRLYSPEEYCPIDNPYAPLADGGPVPLNSNMFYGREEFISNIVDAIIKSPSKQIIIYGQKRCGKSSVMLHLKEKLLETGKTFCVFFSLGEIINHLTEATFFHKILSSIHNELELGAIDGTFESIPNFEIPNIYNFEEEDEGNPLNTFIKYMIKFKLLCKHTQGWENKNLVVMIDEFTYLYTEIKKHNISPSIMKQWKAVTQNERAQFSVVLVGQDVVPSFKKEDYAKNAFGVIQDIRLTYLKEEPARALIEKPILDENGRSRYIDGAVSKIIEYTSRNPYYIQIFCSRLVDYMNANKLISVTEADVENVARSFVEGSDALVEDKFDNLIRAGETKDFQEFPEDDILSILRQVSLNSKNIGFCNRNDINVLQDKEEEDKILKHLTDREVLEKKGDDNYRILVKLFQEWLLNH